MSTSDTPAEIAEKRSLPTTGWASEDILDHLRARKLDPIRGHWSKVFRAPEDIQKLGQDVYREFFSDNGLLSARAPYMRDIEVQVIDMCLSLMSAPKEASGTMTSGGSESIYSALHALREWARASGRGGDRPEVIAPYSAHPAFSKGCHYYDLTLTRVPLGDDLRADPAAMEAAIGENTVAIVGSAPCWPYGFYDPLSALGDVASRHDLWMHVDACVGGYLSPFAKAIGRDIPAWDFEIPAVQSISADLHKFGYCPKPCSTVLWRSKDLLKYHHVHPSDWPGGEYAATGMAGSRNAGAIFAAWAVMTRLGFEGYCDLARHVFAQRDKLAEQLNALGAVRAWQTDLLPLPVEGVEVDIGLVSATLVKKGWIILGAQEPPLINIPIDAATTDEVIDTLVSDIREIIDGIRAGEITGESVLTYG